MIVLEGGRRERAADGAGASLAKLALRLAPDVLHAVERSLAERERRAQPGLTMLPGGDRRRFTSGVRLSEVEIDTAVPFVRRVVVRSATAWASDLPFVEPAAPRRGRLRRAGAIGAGSMLAVGIAALGMLAGRATDPRRR